MPDQPTPEPTAVTRATAAMQAFLGAFWNGSTQSFYKRTDPTNRGSADFWWLPQCWQLAMDQYERTRDAASRQLIDEIYDGAVRRYPGLSSDFNDDRGWWALAATRAYQLTGETRFLTEAETIFAAVWSSWDGTYGGGIWWRRSVHDQKNVATNAPAAATAVRLFRLTGNEAYLADAVAVIRWIDATLRQGDRLADHIEGTGTVVDWQFTYNYGTYAAAAAELSGVTGDRSYRDSAVGTVTYATESLAPQGILADEGDGDGGPFKGIFVRCLGELIRTYGETQFLPFVHANAQAAWASRNAAGLIGPAWTSAATGSVESGAASSGVAVLELDAGLP